MSPTRQRKWLAGILVLASATVFQYLPMGCTNFGTALGLSAFDFCAVFNCSGGTFFDLCNPFAILMDCPGTAGTTQTTQATQP
jgi:hypothetical protein